MHGPPLAGWLLVALCAATGSYCLLRMRGEPPGRLRRAAGAEALMGWGMAVMAVPAAALDPRPWGPPLLAAVFGVAAVRALLPGRRDGGPLGHHLHHAVGASAMVYMALAMAVGGPAGGPRPRRARGPGAGAGRGACAHRRAAGVLRRVCGVVGDAPPGAGRAERRGGARFGGGSGGGAGGLAWSRRPELAEACRLSMGIGMFAMLLTL
ncbi:DUF5134 domain-containing protein [Streptomyces sparsogenes]|uniref:Integral membrane protein n=1 Tax=Streptomyces sparsogenes DSM 40356 TaxID=1331668 RepID=A0A1R1S804_9ACTN|nr:DUF5134 domain-containing protein [Streptomyces sparsogenes]OMI34342.1 integral membrane protein [Streptomyces sparsogenes DSM 40356]